MNKLEKIFYTTYIKFLTAFFVLVIIATPLTPVAAFSGILPVPTTSPLVVSMDNYALTVGQTAVVTFAFSTTSLPASFSASSISATNGTISNLTVTSNPLVYTATFTPSLSVSSDSNVITVNLPFATTTYALGVNNPNAIAFDGTNMWTANSSDTVTKTSQNGTANSYTVSGYPIAIAFDGVNMWTANYNGSSVTKISPDGATTTYSGIGNNPIGIAFDGTNMWVANLSSNSVTKISPIGATTTYTGVGSGPNSIAFDGTNMWTTNVSGGNVTRIASNGATTTYPVSLQPSSVAFDGTNMWTANVGLGDVTKITPFGATTTYTMPTRPNAIAFDGTNMWTANSNGNSVTKISPSGSTTIYGVGSGTNPGAIAFDGVNMWTANYNGNSVTRVAPAFTVSSPNYTVNTNVVTPTPISRSGSRSYTSPLMRAQQLSLILAPSPSATAYIDSLNQVSVTTSNQKKSELIFKRDLTFGSTGPDVQALQIYLNANGFTVSSSGPGSPGNESTSFGALTRSALARFQKERGIIPAKGYFGPITRAILNN